MYIICIISRLSEPGNTSIIVWLPAKLLGLIHKDFRNHYANYSLNEIYNY